MSLLRFLDMFAGEREAGPTLSIRRGSLFGHDRYIIATWPDGTCRKVRHFIEETSARYWMDVEAHHWLARHSLSEISEAEPVQEAVPAMVLA